jgi:hypothetical protein
MPAEVLRCSYCGKRFVPSVFHHAQRTCSSPECQKRRKTDYHRNRYRSDPEYRLVCRESDQKWRSHNPDYQRSYRRDHPAYVEQNRRTQIRRDRKRKVKDLVKNNLAFDLKSASADLWLVGSELEGLVKNNLAISDLIIFQAVSASEVRLGSSCKEHPPVHRARAGL